MQLQHTEQAGENALRLVEEQCVGMQVEMHRVQTECQEHREASASVVGSSGSEQACAESNSPTSACAARALAPFLRRWQWAENCRIMRWIQISVGLRKKGLRVLECRAFACWHALAKRTSGIVKGGKVMFKRRQTNLMRKFLAQLVHHVYSELRSRLVHVPIGELLEHSAKEQRQQQFLLLKNRIVQLDRSLYVWGVAAWKGYMRMAKKLRQQQSAAYRKCLHSRLDYWKLVLHSWAATCRSDRCQRARLAATRQRRDLQTLHRAMTAWPESGRYLKSLILRGARMQRAHRLRHLRSVFRKFAVRVERLNRMRTCLLRLLFRVSLSVLFEAFSVWSAAVRQASILIARSIRLDSRWRYRRKRLTYDALLAHMQKQTDDRRDKRKSSASSSRCCRRFRGARAFRLWSALARHKHRVLSWQACWRARQTESRRCASCCVLRWKQAVTSKHLASAVADVGPAGVGRHVAALYRAFSSFHLELRRSTGARRALQRLSRRRWRWLVLDAFRKWKCWCRDVILRYGLACQALLRCPTRLAKGSVYQAWAGVCQVMRIVTRHNLRSRTKFERLVYVRCARYWFAASAHRSNSEGQVTLWRMTKQRSLAAGALASLREWAFLARRNKRRADSGIKSDICLALRNTKALARGCVSRWRSMCMNERGRRVLDHVLIRLQRQRSLRTTLVSWCWSSRLSQAMGSAQRALERKSVQLANQSLQVAMKEWACRAGQMHADRITLLRHGVKRARRLQRKAFERLLLLCKEPTAAAMLGIPLFGYRKLCKSVYFEAWCRGASAQRHLSKTHHHQKQQALRRAAKMVCSMMLTKWKHFAQGVGETMLQLSRFMRKTIRRCMWRCLSRWQGELHNVCRACDYAEHRLAKSRASHLKEAFRAWTHHLENLEKFPVVERAAAARARAARLLAWDAWLEQHAVHAQHVSGFWLLASKMRMSRAKHVAAAWLAKCQACCSRLRRLKKAACRCRYTQNRQYFCKWMSALIRARRYHRIQRRIAARRRCSQARMTWVSWHASVRRVKEDACKLRHLHWTQCCAILRRSFRLWQSSFASRYGKAGAGTSSLNQKAAARALKLLVSCKSRRVGTWVLRAWSAASLRSLALKRAASLIVSNLRGFVLRRFLETWLLVWRRALEQSTRITEESLVGQIQVLSQRRLDHIAKRMSRFSFRQHLRAWQDVTAGQQLVSRQCRRKRHACLRVHLQDWREWLKFCHDRMVQQLSRLVAALLLATKHNMTGWIEARQRAHAAFGLLQSRSKSYLQKASFHGWHLRCDLTSARLHHGARCARKRAPKVVCRILVQWKAYTLHRSWLGRRLSKMICKRADGSLEQCLAAWAYLMMSKRFLSRCLTRALARRSSKVLSAATRQWQGLCRTQRFLLILVQRFQVRALRRDRLLLGEAVEQWRMVAVGRRTQNSVRSTLTANRNIIRTLQHLSCAQLLMASVGKFEMAIARQVRPLMPLAISTVPCLHRLARS